ncbi:MAG: dephospho-CoA kinase, partial [Planctomycetes bacterium]|nr:dephospho-CoA kinase [Planctomycetota bacterium]
MARNPASAPAARPAFRPGRPLVVGITGGVAAGKSTVAELFCAHGLVHVDADAHARAVAADPEVLAAVRARFGAGVVGPDGLDRAALARVVFAD